MEGMGEGMKMEKEVPDTDLPIILVPNQVYEEQGMLFLNISMQDTKTRITKMPGGGVLLQVMEPCTIRITAINQAGAC